MLFTRLLSLGLGLLAGGLAKVVAGYVEPRSNGSAISGNFSGLVSIGNRSIYLECQGTGSPTVVLEAGYRSAAIVWTTDLVQPQAPRTMVLQGVAAFTHVCVYDRPGVAVVEGDELIESRSDPVPQPRTATSVVDELHALLHAAGIPGPYVLAAHSLGGLFVRLFASTYPDEVTGMVLVDAWYEGLQHLLTPTQWADYVLLNFATPSALASYPALETLNFSVASATMRQAAAAHPLRPMPLGVLAHGETFGISAGELGFSPGILERAWRQAQKALVTLVPQARFTIALNSGHYIQLQQPELVIEAIRQAVQGVWYNDTWYELTSCCCEWQEDGYAWGMPWKEGSFHAIDIKGRGGLSLKDHWIDAPKTHLGTATAGFPNLLIVNGPGAPFANNPPASEESARFVADVISHAEEIRKKGTGTGVIESTKEADEQWLEELVKIANLTLFAKTPSWFFGENIPGKKVAPRLYLGGLARYRSFIAEEKAKGFRGFRFGEFN